MSTHLHNKMVDLGVSLAVVGVAGAVLWWLGGKVIDKAVQTYDTVTDAVPDTVKPSSDKNIVYRGVSSLSDWWDNGEVDNSASFGTWLYEWQHKGEDYEF